MATPHNILKKHANQLQTLEAILLGQAGLISDQPRDAYEAKLAEEYHFYRQKFGLTPIAQNSFNRLRVRPVAFPTRRLAMVARWLQQYDALLTAFAQSDRATIEKIFALPPSEYWLKHYDFGHLADHTMGALGKQSRLTMLINVIVPTSYYYALQRGDETAAKRAISWLYELPAEVNAVTSLFTTQGVKIQNAAESQALLELYRSYCEKYHCLSCPMATEIFQVLRH